MPVVVGGLQLAVDHSGPGGVTATNVLAFQSTGGDFDNATMQSLVGAFAGNLAAQLSEEWDYGVSYRAYRLGVDPPDTLEGSATGIPGAQTGDVMSANVALCVSLGTGTAGRRGRGRIFLPGIARTNVSNDSTVGPTFATDTVLAYSDFAVDAAALLWLPAVYSRLDSVVRHVTSVSVDLVVDTQRRRTERLVS